MANKVIIEAHGDVLHDVVGKPLGQLVAVEVEVLVAGERLEALGNQISGLEAQRGVVGVGEAALGGRPTIGAGGAAIAAGVAAEVGAVKVQAIRQVELEIDDVREAAGIAGLGVVGTAAEHQKGVLVVKR